MKTKRRMIHIELLPPLEHRLLRVVILLCILGASGRADAALKEFEDNQVLTADDLNQNFEEVDTRVSSLTAAVEALQKRLDAIEETDPRLVIERGESQYSLGATLCGLGPFTSGQITGGYSGAKALCEQACGGSPTAHMCSTDEMVRSEQMGISPEFVDTDAAWISTGVFASEGDPDADVPLLFDCAGWSNNTNEQSGVLWKAGRPGINFCAGEYPIACCD